MIEAEFFVSHDGRLTGFHITGHSGYEESGKDVVCAFVSSGAYMAANTITDVIGADAQAEAEDGDMLLCVNGTDIDRCRDILEGLKLHLMSVQEQHPEYLKVIISEV